MNKKFYKEIYEMFKTDILSGKYSFSHVFPCVGMLVRKFNLSDGTVHHAFDELVHQGFVSCEQGRGTFDTCAATSRKDVIDVDNLDNYGPSGNGLAFRSLVDNGATGVPEQAITHRSLWSQQPDGPDRWSRMLTPLIVTHSMVFRADSTTARLTLTDLGKDDDPVGRIGQRRAMNYVIVRPYYEEKPIGVIDVGQEDQ